MFQTDSTFMLIMVVLFLVVMLNKRNNDIIINAKHIFYFIAFMITFNTLGITTGS